MSDWCILRTSGRHTLSLASSLAEAGFEAWTPAQILPKRKAVVQSRKPKQDQPEERAPIMPTFVFARAKRLVDLIRLSEIRLKPQPDFSVFRYMGKIPLVADRDIDPLRTAEARVVPKKRQRIFREGETVRIPEGPFGGMSGVIEQADGQYALVCFGGRVSVKIATFLLRANVPQGDVPATRAA